MLALLARLIGTYDTLDVGAMETSMLDDVRRETIRRHEPVGDLRKPSTIAPNDVFGGFRA